MPTSTILFPDLLVPVLNGYTKEPRADLLVATEFDTGAEQVNYRRPTDNVPERRLHNFKFRARIVSKAESSEVMDFLDLVGNGDVNFTFWPPETTWRTALPLGLTDGTSTLILPWRLLGSWSGILVDGSPVTFGIDNEFVDPTKEDRISWIDTDPPAGQEIILENAYGRPRHICRMQSWRAGPYKGGEAGPIEFQPEDDTLPLFRQQYEFTFKEKG